MSNLAATLSVCAGFALFFLYAGLFEYAFHRWVLHHRWRLIRHPYQVHTFLHHRVFRGDAADQVRQEEDRDPIVFEWWQGPLLLAVQVPLVWGVQVVIGFPVFWGGMTALAVYYGLYEYLHWSMHTPTGQWIKRTRVFRYLDAHHQLHHRLWHVNFNVVFPLGDMVFGTFRPTINPLKAALRTALTATRWGHTVPLEGRCPRLPQRRAAMSNAKASKTLSLPLLHVHEEECGDGGCGCGCGDIAHVTIKDAEKVVESQDCCEPVCGPETCG